MNVFWRLFFRRLYRLHDFLVEKPVRWKRFKRRWQRQTWKTCETFVGKTIGSRWLERDCGSSRRNYSRPSKAACDRTAVTRHGISLMACYIVSTFAPPLVRRLGKGQQQEDFLVISCLWWWWNFSLHPSHNDIQFIAISLFYLARCRLWSHQSSDDGWTDIHYSIRYLWNTNLPHPTRRFR